MFIHGHVMPKVVLMAQFAAAHHDHLHVRKVERHLVTAHIVKSEPEQEVSAAVKTSEESIAPVIKDGL